MCIQSLTHLLGEGYGPKKARKHQGVMETRGFTEKDRAKSLPAHGRLGQRLVYYVCQVKYKKIVSPLVESKSVQGANTQRPGH